MKKWIKWTLTTVVLTLLIALGLYLAWTGTQREEQRVAPEDPPVPVTVRELKPGDFTLTALYNGKLEAVSDVSVITMVRGIVIDDRISEGQRVSKGQVLYRLDDDSYRFSMLQAEASVQLARENLRKIQNITRPEEIRRLEALAGEAQANLNKARGDAQRYGELYREGAVSLSQKESVDLSLAAAGAQAEVADENLKQARSGARKEDIAQARASLAQAEASYRLAKDVWEDTTIRSPISGIVSSKEIFEGDTLEAGMPMCEIVDLSSFRIDLGVTGSDIPGLIPGGTASIALDDDRKTYQAVIENVGVKADERTGTFPVILRMDNPDNEKEVPTLRAGMDVTVSIIRKRIPGVLVIPTSSLLRETEAAAVFVVKNGTAAKKAIHLGAANEVEAVVAAGLDPGDLLVIVGQHRLKPGDMVEMVIEE